MRRILVTGATGKVGRRFIERIGSEAAFADMVVRAFCHQRILPAAPRLEIVHGSVADRSAVREALAGVSHVLHLAACQESEDEIIDVAVKGMYWLLEECRASAAFQQFILIGGGAGMGRFLYPHPNPATPAPKHFVHRGCYALAKVLEEVILDQYGHQYDFNGCCLRTPWIVAKDDFKRQLSFGDNVFGGPRLRDLVGAAKADEYTKHGTIPIMLDADWQPVRRSFVHIDDLIDAVFLVVDHPKSRRQSFNICMDEPVDYRELADYLQKTRGLPSVKVPTPFRTTWLDNAKARLVLGWRPKYDMARMADEAFDYRASVSLAK